MTSQNWQNALTAESQTLRKRDNNYNKNKNKNNNKKNNNKRNNNNDNDKINKNNNNNNSNKNNNTEDNDSDKKLFLQKRGGKENVLIGKNKAGYMATLVAFRWAGGSD